MGFLLLVAVVALAIGAFWKLATLAAAGNDGARFLAIVESAALLVSAGAGLLAGLFLLGFRCDESCDESVIPSARTGAWWHTQDAWQWWAQFGFVLAGTLAVGAALVLTLRRRYDLAPTALLIAAGCFVIWALFLAPLGNRLGI